MRGHMSHGLFPMTEPDRGTKWGLTPRRQRILQMANVGYRTLWYPCQTFIWVHLSLGHVYPTSYLLLHSESHALWSDSPPGPAQVPPHVLSQACVFIKALYIYSCFDIFFLQDWGPTYTYACPIFQANCSEENGLSTRKKNYSQTNPMHFLVCLCLL